MYDSSLKPGEFNRLEIVAGTNHIYDPDEISETAYVVNRIVRDDYGGADCNWENDVALVTLDRDINENGHSILYATIDTDPIVPLRTHAQLPGWGARSYFHAMYAGGRSDLHKVEIRIQEIIHCNGTDNLTQTIIDCGGSYSIDNKRHVCAGEDTSDGVKGGCFGDSGGALVRSGTRSIIGITSFGAKGSSGKYNISECRWGFTGFTRASFHLDWINENAKKSLEIRERERKEFISNIVIVFVLLSLFLLLLISTCLIWRFSKETKKLDREV